MTCQRCKTDEARYCAYTVELQIPVCASCAWMALESGIAIDVLHRWRTDQHPDETKKSVDPIWHLNKTADDLPC